jgi:hypothetical protein
MKDKNKFIVIYVDNMIIAAPIEQLVDSVITRIARHFLYQGQVDLDSHVSTVGTTRTLAY